MHGGVKRGKPATKTEMKTMSAMTFHGYIFCVRRRRRCWLLHVLLVWFGLD